MDVRYYTKKPRKNAGRHASLRRAGRLSPKKMAAASSKRGSEAGRQAHTHPSDGSSSSSTHTHTNTLTHTQAHKQSR